MELDALQEKNKMKMALNSLPLRGAHSDGPTVHMSSQHHNSWYDMWIELVGYRKRSEQRALPTSSPRASIARRDHVATASMRFQNRAIISNNKIITRGGIRAHIAGGLLMKRFQLEKGIGHRREKSRLTDCNILILCPSLPASLADRKMTRCLELSAVVGCRC